jgi:argininosuccinate lyase
MSGEFSQVYVEQVLDPAYRNWKRLFPLDSVRVHKAHLVMLRERGIVAEETALAIARAMDTMAQDFRPPARIPEGSEDLYFVYEKELERIAGSENAAWLHTARSRNDMDTTIFRLALKRELRDFAAILLSCCKALDKRAREGSSELTVLYTHGQPANVSTMAHYLSSFLLELLEDAEVLMGALSSVDRCTLGACAITGTGFAIDRERTARLLGFAAIVPNSYQAISTSHWLVRPASALKLLLSDLTRFAADLLHKASCEVGLIDFPDELVQSSSIMPQKRNPVILEHIRIQAGLAAGTCSSMEDLFRNVPWQDVNEAADAPVSLLIDSLSTARSAVALLEETATKFGSNERRAREIALAFGVTTTELADSLVRECGVGFRCAHGVCSAFARSGYDKAVLRKAFSEAALRELPFSDAEIDANLLPERFVSVRRTAGGPAPDGMASVWAAVDTALARVEAALLRMDDREERASAELDAAWAGLHSPQ